MEDRNHQLLKLSWVLKKGHEKYLEEILSTYHLSQNEGSVLLFLYHHKMTTAKEISKYRSISKSLVSKSIEALYERGYLVVQEDDMDKRIHRLYLTKDSMDIAKELDLSQKRFYSLLEKDLSQKELQVMDRVLEKLHLNISEELNGKV